MTAVRQDWNTHWVIVAEIEGYRAFGVIHKKLCSRQSFNVKITGPNI
jgi:hypothetical protein